MKTHDSPWRFLTSLDGDVEADRELLKLTRGEELQIITNMVTSSRASILYATSGNGKSSIVNAGLVPHFRQRGHLVLITRPRPPSCTTDPCTAFKQCVAAQVATRETVSHANLAWLRNLAGASATAEVPTENETIAAARELLAKLEATEIAMRPTSTNLPTLAADDTVSLLDFVRTLQPNGASEKPIIFICDQFEELFVHFTNRAELARFVEQLGAVWAAPNLNVRILFSMREDWVGSMIEFRRTIPTAFNDCFKLNPLRRSAARHVLTWPLRAAGHGQVFASDAVDAILADLAQAYGETRAHRTWGAFSESAEGEDGFIELPALQIIAEKMWETRTKAAAAFSIEHYDTLPTLMALIRHDVESQPPLPSSNSHVSPAEIVLRDYLEAHIAEPNEPDSSIRQSVRETRIDCLYALTDGERHRRALPEKKLLEEITRTRAIAGEQNGFGEDKLRARLAKLKEARILIEQPGADPQLELAHDFAVRAAVTEWRQLERRRIAQASVKAEQQKLAEILTGRIEGFWMMLPHCVLFCFAFWLYLVADRATWRNMHSDTWLVFAIVLAIVSLASASALAVVSRLDENARIKIGGWLVLLAIEGIEFWAVTLSHSWSTSERTEFLLVGTISGALCGAAAFIFGRRVREATESRRAKRKFSLPRRLAAPGFWALPLTAIVILLLVVVSQWRESY
jgi:hypothetical protein